MRGRCSTNRGGEGLVHERPRQGPAVRGPGAHWVVYVLVRLFLAHSIPRTVGVLLSSTSGHPGTSITPQAHSTVLYGYTRATYPACVPSYPLISWVCGLVAFSLWSRSIWHAPIHPSIHPPVKTCCNQQADKAISSIKPAHIQEVKKLPNPADVIKMVFDCILLLFHLPVSFSMLLDTLSAAVWPSRHSPLRI